MRNNLRKVLEGILEFAERFGKNKGIEKWVIPDEQMEEQGILVMQQGEMIELHQHTEDMEMYLVLEGIVRINGRLYREGEFVSCFKGESHDCKNIGSETATIMFIKIVPQKRVCHLFQRRNARL